MRLAVRTDYALRVLMYVGLAPGRLATTADIAAAHAISENHLTVVVHRLGALGYLETVRGKGGGIRLAEAPGAVNLGEVVRHLETDMTLVECFGTGRCRIERACVLRDVLGEALEAFLAVLDRYTLADLLAPRAGLAELLGCDRPAA
jgi:Rrf2 family transcriptional regulator, nitric oxide-sensitive transcriptional repressor